MHIPKQQHTAKAMAIHLRKKRAYLMYGESRHLEDGHEPSHGQQLQAMRTEGAFKRTQEVEASVVVIYPYHKIGQKVA